MKTAETVLEEKLRESIAFIRKTVTMRPRIGVVLGSGLGYFADSMTPPGGTAAIATARIPHYPQSTIQGHSGRILFGRLHRQPLVVFQGRVHYYESGDLESILYPVRIARQLGVRTLLVTNAAGGVNPAFRPADLMLITDQVNLTFENPLRGMIGRPGFPAGRRDGAIYDPGLQRTILKAARSKGIALQQGVYCGMKGPSYETAAEVRMSRLIGSDAVGMSTVNEASLAHALGMRVGGISCITNLSTGITNQRLTHDEVTEVALRVQRAFSALLDAVIEQLA